jgi:pimeloyl-ACP methyl ester carboxylesterase
MPRTPERVVDELHTLLANAGERAPYVMVAHTLGGRYVRLFAQRYPNEITGMVLVDARSEYHDQALSEKARADLIAQNQPGSMLTWMRRLGVIRMFGAQIYTSQLPELAKLSPETQRAFAVLGARPKAQEAGYSQLVHMTDSDEILQAANLGNMPLRVFASAQTIAMEPTWLPGQERQAALSTNSALRTLPGGHYLQLANADEVRAAIRDVVQIKN